MTSEGDSIAELKFAHNVIEHLGIKLYKNKSGNVLAELLANSWDADATRPEIRLSATSETPESGWIVVEDDGIGMDYAHIKDHYLHVGKPKRRKPSERSPGGRRPMGRKGLGKLAPFGIARVVDVASISGGELNWFTLNLDEILAQGEDGRYPPVFHLQQADCRKEVSVNGNPLSEEIERFRKSTLMDAGGSGTFVRMSGVPLTLLPSRSDLAEDLGARFTVVLLRDDFKVSINSTIISEAEALPQFEFRIPEGGGTSEELVGGNKVRFWCGFVRTAEWSSDQAGVGVFAHGKVAQTRPYFFNKKGKEVFQRYLYAVVEADWIDEESDDYISTDRTSIDWTSPKLSELHAWGERKVSAWISSYERFRKEAQDREVAEQARSLRDRGLANRYSRGENAQIDSLVSDATRSIGKSKSAEKTREDLIVAVSKAWINEPTRSLLGSLWSKLRQDPSGASGFNAIVEQLSAHSVPEKMGLALTFSQRAFALTVLHDLVHRDSETDLQRLVTEFPWILQPRGDLLTADRTLKSTIDEAADSLGDLQRYDPGLVIQNMSPSQRADFVFLTSQDVRAIRVIEIKQPRLQLGVEQERQLASYMDFIQAQRSEAKVSGVLVGNKKNFQANDRRIDVKSWSEIFLECRAAYVEMLASMLELSDIDGADSRMNVIKAVGGEQTWELLRRLSETDDKLKQLFEDFDLAAS